MKPAAPPKVVVSSSPGRAEKLPAPGLAGLLRGKSGSRSRGRGSASRASPMFVSRSKSVGRPAAAAMEVADEGEPSSPKVTCIGQVRIRKMKKKPKSAGSKSAGSKSTGSAAPPPMRCRCWCLQRALLCKIRISPWKTSSGGPRRSLWRRWAVGLRSGRKGSYRQQRNAIGNESDPTPDWRPDVADPLPGASIGELESDGEEEEKERGESEGEEEAETRVFVSSTPPKNALLLMRCRSAPHNRSSALSTARLSVSSPLQAEESPEGGKAVQAEEEEEEGARSGGGSSRTDGGDGEEEGFGEGSGPLVLTRCKSEPAKKAARMVVPEAEVGHCFWNNSNSWSGRRRRRLGLVQEEEGAHLSSSFVET